MSILNRPYFRDEEAAHAFWKASCDRRVRSVRTAASSARHTRSLPILRSVSATGSGNAATAASNSR
jgi:hypothetical protein